MSLSRILRIQPSSFHCRPAKAFSVAYEMALTIAVPLGTYVQYTQGAVLRVVRRRGSLIPARRLAEITGLQPAGAMQREAVDYLIEESD